MHEIIYRCRQRSGREYMAVAFKSSYVIKDWSQFLFGSWRNNLNQVVPTVYPEIIHKSVHNPIDVISG
jgi:hypothetical protein